MRRTFLKAAAHAHAHAHANTTNHSGRVKNFMKAAVIKGKSQLVVDQLPIPKPADGEFLVKIHSCGVCHTDVHVIDSDWGTPKCQVPGHEGCGVIHEIGGSGVHPFFKVGDRVGLPWLGSCCLNCEYCLSGWQTLCPKQENAGFSINGGMSEWAIAPASGAIPVPNNLSFTKAAPILCAGVTAYKALKEAEVHPGEFVTLIGAAGGLGHLGIQYANAMGYRVIALDLTPEKLAFCKKMGAEFAFDMSEKSVHQILEVTNGGSHGVVCFAPNANGFKTSVDVARRKGTAVLVGLPNASFQLPIVDVVLKRITVRGSIVGSRKDAIEALDFAARGEVESDIKTIQLDEIVGAIDRLRSGKVEGRTVIEMPAH